MATPTCEIPDEVKRVLDRAAVNEERTVVMTCGISGSGKSTLARNIASHYPNFERLSIDKCILERYGVYNVDYPASSYSSLQEGAEQTIIADFKSLLREGERDFVLDMAFYSKETRNEYRRMVRECGEGRYQVLMVVFKGSEEVLWRRIEGRRVDGEKTMGEEEGREGMNIDRETLGVFLKGFEWPVGEGEIMLTVK